MGLGLRLVEGLWCYPRAYRLARGAFRRLRRLFGREGGPLLAEVPANAPTSVSVEITQRCNLNCPMCYRHVTDIRGTEMPLADYRRILDQFPALQSVNLVGKGETLMHREIKGILSLHRERGLPTIIVTNGHLLSPEIVQLLLPGSSVHVSIDSPDPDRYRGYRGAELAPLLRRLREAIAAGHQEITWALNTVVVTENLQDLPATVELAAGLGCKAVSFLLPMIFSADKEGMHPYRQREMYERMLDKALDCAARERIVLVFRRRQGFRPRGCLDPWITPRISVTGDVYPCCYIHVANEDAHTFRWAGQDIPVPQANYVMGNLLRGDDMTEMWTGEKFCAVRRQLLSLEHAEKRPSYDSLLAEYTQDTSGFNFCDVCMYRHGIHC